MRMWTANTTEAGREVDTPATGFIAVLLLFVIATCALISVSAAGEPALPQPRSSPAGPTQSYEGMITDTHCGAKHSAAIGKAAADCARVCVHGGEHFALIDGDSVYVLEGDTDTLKRMAGQRVRIIGVLSANTISVSSIAASD